MKNKVTIQDIADALGVSRNTVSKAINNSDGLADATREKILQKAFEMGYKQFSYVNTLTRSAAELPGTLRFAGEIALLTTKFLNSSHFSSVMLDKFQREISQMGFTLNTHRVTERNLADKTLPSTFLVERCSAIICIEMFDREYDEMVCGLDVPVLFVDGPPKHEGNSLPADQLYMENIAPVTGFVRHMLEKGQRRIGFVGNYNLCQSFYERYLAFRLVMTLENAEVRDGDIFSTNSAEELNELFRARTSDDLPQVLICANDFVALDVMRILNAKGLRVPDDIKLFGFDDSAESRIVEPNLSTVHIHTQIMAFSAMHLLVSRMKEPYLDYRYVYTETELVYRDSTKLEEAL
jgi:LacI family transcriptional regulator